MRPARVACRRAAEVWEEIVTRRPTVMVAARERRDTAAAATTD